MLLQEFWDDRYVGYCERLREVTRVGYESAWRCHVEPVFGSMELADIGVDDIELWLSGFASPGAARKAWAVLRQMLRKAAKWGYLEVDVTRLEIDLPAKPLHVPRLLTIGQTRRQLQGFYGHALEAWLIVDSCLALRPEEGYGVDWADIDMRSGITHIQRGVQWVAGHEVVVPPKTELSDRFLPLPRFAVRRFPRGHARHRQQRCNQFLPLRHRRRENGVERHRIYQPIRRYIRLLDYRVAFPNPNAVYSVRRPYHHHE